MTASFVPEQSPASGALHARRCARHPLREAAVRCPECHEFFCRECVVEHDGRYLCAACLSRLVAREERRREWTAKARRIGIAAAGALLLWMTFQGIGSLLLKIPPELHEGTVWKKLESDTAP